MITHLTNLESSMKLARSEQLFSKNITSSPRNNNCLQESLEIELKVNNVERSCTSSSSINSSESNNLLKENEMLTELNNHPTGLLKTKNVKEINKIQSPHCDQSYISELPSLYFDNMDTNDHDSLVGLNNEQADLFKLLDDEETSVIQSLKRKNSCISISPSSSIESTHTINTLNEQESWMGLKNEPYGPFSRIKSKKIRPTKYTMPCGEIDRILNSSRMRSFKKTLLLNGNISTPSKIKSHIYVVSNTCAFDSIAIAIAVTYNDYDVYKEFVDMSKNNFLLFSKNIAIKGPNKLIYTKRVELLELHFDKSAVLPRVQTINAECNVTKIIERYFKDEPSAIEHVSCIKCGENIRSSPTIIFPVKNCSSVEHLQEQLDDYTNIRYASCSKCGSCKTSKRILGNRQSHIYRD